MRREPEGHGLANKAWSAAGLERRLRRVGAEEYHDRHPFHRLLHDGGLSLGQVRAWALNRAYYQTRIPLKDAKLMARIEDPGLRRIWRRRLADHDGETDSEGGIGRWLALTDDLGLERELVLSGRAVLPGVRFAVDAYVQFVAERTLLEAIASSLSELFAPAIIAERRHGMLTHYPFIRPDSLVYFTVRPPQAERDSAFALDYVRRHARTREEQESVVAALRFKCSVLWAQLDALYHAYVEPAHVPPGAFVPAES